LETASKSEQASESIREQVKSIHMELRILASAGSGATEECFPERQALWHKLQAVKMACPHPESARRDYVCQDCGTLVGG